MTALMKPAGATRPCLHQGERCLRETASQCAMAPSWRPLSMRCSMVVLASMASAATGGSDARELSACPYVRAAVETSAVYRPSAAAGAARLRAFDRIRTSTGPLRIRTGSDRRRREIEGASWYHRGRYQLWYVSRGRPRVGGSEAGPIRLQPCLRSPFAVEITAPPACGVFVSLRSRNSIASTLEPSAHARTRLGQAGRDSLGAERSTDRRG